jgi:integrase
VAGQPGQIREVAPGVWRLRVYCGRSPSGSPILKSKTVYGGVRFAQKELAKLVADVARGNTATGSETLGQLLATFVDHVTSLGRSPTTLREYKRFAERVVPKRLRDKKLALLSARDLDAFYRELGEKGLSPMSVRHVHSFLGAALHQAERWRMVDHNVARQATPPAVHMKEVEAPEPDEVQRIIRAAETIEPTFAVLLIVAALTGARRGELCALRWSDLDWETGTLQIARSVYELQGGGWSEKATKTHQVRRIGLDDIALAVLRKHRNTVDALASELGLDMATDAFIFSRSPAGFEPLRPGVVSNFTRRVAMQAGVSTHLHALRHFSATQAIAAGYDPVTVSKRLGHADPSITLRVYGHAVEQRDRELAASLGKTLALPRPS